MEDQMFAPDYNDMIEKEQLQISTLKIKKKVKLPEQLKEEPQSIQVEELKQQSRESQQNHNIQVSKFQKSDQQYIQTNIKDMGFRQELRTKSFRNFQNLIKNMLINIYCKIQQEKLNQTYTNKYENKLSILDIGCGKGGDLTKWAHNNIGFYMGIDPSSSHLTEAHNRYNSLKKSKKFDRLYTQYLKCASGSDPLKNCPYFDLISSMFVVHYMFDSQENAENLFRNIGNSLVDGGYFFCIIADSNVMVKRLRNSSTQIDDGNYVFGNEFYKVKFESKFFPKDKLFGISYGFYLEDAIGKKQLLSDKEEMITYTEEFLIVDKALNQLADQNNLKIIRNQNLLDFYQSEKSQFLHLFRRQENVELPLWEVSHLYKVVVMQKSGGQGIKFDRNWSHYKQEIKKEMFFT